MLPPRQVRGTDDIDEVVRYRTTDLTRLTQISKIVTKVERREMDVRAAAAASADAVGARHPYPRWVASAAWAGLAAAVALLLGGHPLSAMTAFVVTALIDRLGRPLARWGVARFFLQMVGALVGTVATLALLALGVLPPGPEPSLVIAAGITVLLSGLSVVGAVPDAISGFYVTAAGRAAEIALLSAGLLAVGLSLDPAGAVAADVTRLGISTCAAAAAAVMFSLACYAPVRALSVAGLTGGAGWAAYGCLTLFAHAGPVYLRASRRRRWGSRPRFRGAAR